MFGLRGLVVSIALWSAACAQSQIGASGFDFDFVESRGSVAHALTLGGFFAGGDSLGGGVDGAGFDSVSRSITGLDQSSPFAETGFDIAQFVGMNPYGPRDTVALSAYTVSRAVAETDEDYTTTGLANLQLSFRFDEPFIVRGHGLIRSTETEQGDGASGRYFGNINISGGIGGTRLVNEFIGGAFEDELEFSFEAMVEPQGLFDDFKAEINLDSFASSSLFGESAGYGVEAELVLEFVSVPSPSVLTPMAYGCLLATRRRR